MVKFLRSALLLLVASLSANAQVLINEFSCSNSSQYADVFGSYEDWVEIYNPTANTIDISGYYLSDKATNPTKWQVPAGVTIQGMGRKLFICSGNDVLQNGQYHTNFKLTQCKQEYIIIANASGQVIDSLHIILPTQRNHSYARITDGAATWGVGLSPTPGTANNGVKQYYAATPVPTQIGGFYGSAITVTLNTSEPNSVIRYTVDGSEPIASSTLYSAPISIPATKAIRAKTFSNSPTIPPSFTVSNTYIIGTTHTVPVFCLNGNFNSLFNGQTGELQNSLEYYDSTGVFKYKMEGDMKRHGNDSWAFEQKGMRFYTRDEYGFANNIEQKLFPESPRDEFDVIIIKAAGSDNYPCASNQNGLQSCHLRDAYVQTIADKYHLNVDTRKYRPCVVYINGQYWGLYELRERVDSDFTDYYYDQPKGKVDMLAYWGGLQLDEGSDTAWVALYNYMMNNDLSIQANYDYVAQRFNTMSLIDYFILDTYTVNSDWLVWNTAWWRGTKDAGVPWKYHLWDMDNTFNLGQNYTGIPTTGYDNPPCSPMDLFPNDPNVPHSDMINALMENDGFRQLYINRYADLINTAFNCTSMIAHLDSLVALLAPEMPSQCQRWNGNMTEWYDHIQLMKDQINGRCGTIADGLIDCYDLTGPYNVTVIVDPPNIPGNKVKVNTIIPNTYPYIASFFGGNDISLLAMPDPTYVFQYWTPYHATIMPSNSSANASAGLISGDTIVAHFKKIFVQGIDENNASFGMSVYPSPTNDKLTIQMTNRADKPMALNVLSITGQLVYSQQNISFNGANGKFLYIIDLNAMGLAPGVYFVRVDDGKTPAVAKFIYLPE